MPAATVTGGVLLLFALTACVPSPDVVLPAEPSLGQPVFASDEEALAAAVAAYTGYLNVAGEIGADSGKGAERMRPFVTDDQYAHEIESFGGLEHAGEFQTGFAKVTKETLQQVWEDPTGVANVIAYFCVDLSEVRFLDSNGLDITNSERADLGQVEVLFISSGGEAPELLIAEVTPWLGHGMCLQ